MRELLPDFVQFARQDLFEAIDWSRQPEYLDKELQAVARRAATGRRYVDLLVKLWRRDGSEQWLLVHVEVQASKEETFAERMYLYHTLLFLRHRRPIVSLAVLTDARADWRPGEYAYEHWGCYVAFGYPLLKLLDWRGREDELAQSPNPFAQVALAQLSALTSRGQQEPLINTRFTVMRHLLRAGLGEAKTVAVLDFLDMVLDLPDDINAQIDAEFSREVEMVRNETPYRPMTSWERRGLAQGRVEGREEGLLIGQQELLAQQLEARFGPLDAERQGRLRLLNAQQLPALGRALLTFASMDDFDRWLEASK